MKRILKTVFTLLVMLTASFGMAQQAEQQEAQWVISEGLGAIRQGDIAGAREAAIQNALQLALEQRMGLRLESERVAENYQLRKSRIESKAAGTVERYEILEENQDQGVYYVKLKVRFIEDAIKENQMYRLKIGVLVSDQATPGGAPSVADVVASAIEKELSSRGIQVELLRGVGGGAPVHSSGTGAVHSAMGSSRLDLPGLATEKSLDLVILAESRCELDSEIEDWKRYRTRVNNCTVYDPRSEEVLAIVNAEAKVRSFKADDAIEESAAGAGRNAAEKVVHKLAAFEPVITARVLLHGMEDQVQIDRIRSHLLNEPSIVEVQVAERDFLEKKAELVIKMKPEFKEKLGDLLQHLPEVELRLLKTVGYWYILDVVR